MNALADEHNDTARTIGKALQVVGYSVQFNKRLGTSQFIADVQAEKDGHKLVIEVVKTHAPKIEEEQYCQAHGIDFHLMSVGYPEIIPGQEKDRFTVLHWECQNCLNGADAIIRPTLCFGCGRTDGWKLATPLHSQRKRGDA